MNFYEVMDKMDAYVETDGYYQLKLWFYGIVGMFILISLIRRRR